MSTTEGGGRIITNGLIVYYDVANIKSYLPTGTTISDLTLNGNDGTLTSGATFSANTFIFPVTGSSITTTLSTNTYNNISMSIWYKHGSNNSLNVLSYLGLSNTTGFGFIINNGTNTNTVGTKIGILYGGSFFNALDTGTLFGTLVNNIWTNLVVTRDLTTTRLYQDGVFLGSTIKTPNSASSFSFHVSEAGSTTLIGSVSGVLVYSRQLTPQEVAQNYNATKSRFGI
jgi:hypothetical protein